MEPACVDLYVSSTGVMGVWSHDLIDVEEAAAEAAADAGLLQGLLRAGNMTPAARRATTARWAYAARNAATANKILASRAGGTPVRMAGGPS